MALVVPCDLAVVRWDSGDNEWQNKGNGGGVLGSTVSGSVMTGSGCAVPGDVTEFSPFTFGTTGATNALPVELISFDVKIESKQSSRFGLGDSFRNKQ